MSAADWLGAEQVRNPRDRDADELRLGACSPLRAGRGRAIAGQADAGHLPLFTAANEPQLF